MHSVLGMDDAAFRASVFAEQKQLAAFSSQSPAERRKLVLALLGVTPLDVARDKLRADARQTNDQHGRLRGMLPDLDEARTSAADMQASADGLETVATEEEKAALAARQVFLTSKERFNKLDLVRQEHEMLVLEGRAARAELEAAKKDVETFAAELADLAGADTQLKELEPKAACLPENERRAQQLAVLLSTANELDGLTDAPNPPPWTKRHWRRPRRVR